jgi:hypothetical protein
VALAENPLAEISAGALASFRLPALELAKKQFVTGESRFFNNFRSNFEGILPPSGQINRHIKHRIFNS